MLASRPVPSADPERKARSVSFENKCYSAARTVACQSLSARDVHTQCLRPDCLGIGEKERVWPFRDYWTMALMTVIPETQEPAVALAREGAYGGQVVCGVLAQASLPVGP